MQNDVNGIGWCLNDYFNDLGIRYLNMGTHGHRALIPFNIPTLFWWESPSGKRILTFRAEHYMTGNTVFKIHSGNFEIFENELLSYLTNLEKKGYKYDLIAIQHSGFLTDNSPPSTSASEMIKQWNEKFVWPKLKTATVSEFFEEMEAKHSTDLPVIRGAWPDWWTDGFGASAREVATVRTAQTDLIANSAGLTMAALQGAKMPEKIDDRIIGDDQKKQTGKHTDHRKICHYRQDRQSKQQIEKYEKFRYIQSQRKSVGPAALPKDHRTAADRVGSLDMCEIEQIQ